MSEADGKATASIVILDDEENMGKILTKLLSMEGFAVSAFDSPVQAVKHITTQGADVVLTDLRMPGMTGEQVLQQVKAVRPTCEVIVMTAYGTVENAMACVRDGAFDYVTKPFDTKVLLATIRKALENRSAGRRAMPIRVPSSAEIDWELIGDSAEIAAVRDLICKIAPTDSAVLISGESGTGKELAARAIHKLSPRAQKRFVAINCASIPENLIESELFGHEKGAFTGAQDIKKGLLEAAEGGTLFLDEIGELPLSLQAKLLRALQEREINRVGSLVSIPINIRVIAATNRRLSAAVQDGEFREDLYYRLNVLNIKMPPLRKRPADVPVLARRFLKELRERAGTPELQITQEVLDELQAMEWPGNVRELRNFIERLVVLSDGRSITRASLAHLANFESQAVRKPIKLDAVTTSAAPAPDAIPDFRQARDQFESEYLRNVLRACHGNVSEAAKKAGMSRRNFYEKIEKLGISVDEFKE